MNVTDWAIRDVPDAFTLLQRAAVDARPGETSQHLQLANTLRGLWPVGARLDLELTPDRDRIAGLRGPGCRNSASPSLSSWLSLPTVTRTTRNPTPMHSLRETTRTPTGSTMTSYPSSGTRTSRRQ